MNKFEKLTPIYNKIKEKRLILIVLFIIIILFFLLLDNLESKKPEYWIKKANRTNSSLENFDQLSTYYNKVLETASSNPSYASFILTAYDNLALLEESYGNSDKAISIYAKLLEISNQDRSYYFRRAKLFKKANSFNEAINDCQKFLSDNKNKDENTLECELIISESFLKTKKYGYSISSYKSFIKNHPDFFEGYKGLADSYFELGNSDMALNIYKDLEYQLKYFLGDTSVAKNGLDRGIIVANQYTNRSNKEVQNIFKDVKHKMGLIYKKYGNNEEALNYLDNTSKDYEETKMYIQKQKDEKKKSNINDYLNNH